MNEGNKNADTISTRMTPEELSELIDKDLPPITEEELRGARKYCGGTIGDVRIATGRFYTPEEFRKYKTELLSKALP